MSFAAESDADRLALLQALGGDVCVFGAASFTAIFERRYAPELGVDGYHPVLTCRESDVSALVEGDSGTVNGTAYKLACDPQADGTGMADIILEAA